MGVKSFMLKKICKSCLFFSSCSIANVCACVCIFSFHFYSQGPFLVCVCVWMCVCVNEWVSVRVSECVCVCGCLCKCVWMCVFVMCVCVWKWEWEREMCVMPFLLSVTPISFLLRSTSSSHLHFRWFSSTENYLLIAIPWTDWIAFQHD